ncbi:MAG TPA: hypothetical protein VLX59_13465 [Acidimicrobiales bacterium]|nr:hypothetical protein [Acidimicrobiales bacterium]
MTTPTISAVSELEDPCLRNLWITQTYHELGVRMSARGLGPDATWALFAVWASKAAGRMIRGEELPAILRSKIEDNPVLHHQRDELNRRWRWPNLLHLTHELHLNHVADVIEAVAHDVSLKLADGNRLVFVELAPVFEALIRGEHPEVTAELRQPVLDYEQALREPDPAKRSVQVLRANVAAVAHEQQRLQSYIAGAVDAPVDEAVRDAVNDHIARVVPGWALKHVAGPAARVLSKELVGVWQDSATALLMRLVTADEDLDLHRTLPAPPGGGPLFAPPLSTSEAAGALGEWDHTHGRGSPCGADDWVSLQQRMGYIVNLFRSRQRRASLAEPPFTPDQLAEMAKGRLPAGPL